MSYWKKLRPGRSLAVVAVWLWTGLGSAGAATVQFHVLGDTKPLDDAVVFAVPEGATPVVAKAPPPATMVQESQQFAPFVLPVQVGTTVSFPNHDPFRHHVYSFSPAKVFELKLYGGGEVEHVTFDKEGVVALGCNIHDNMLAYIYVVNTPFFAKTEGGAAKLDLPPGRYVFHAWHPNGRRGTLATQEAIVTAAGNSIDLAVEVKRDRRQRPPGGADENAY